MRAVILTKSYKKDRYNNSGWCVVALDLEKHRLVRFVDLNGAGIPRSALDSKNIGVMDQVTVQAIRAYPNGPQTENVLVDTSSFNRVVRSELGIGMIMMMADGLPQNEPRFMDDCDYKCMDVSMFHHSIEFVLARNICSDTYWHDGRRPKRYCQFDTCAGHHSKMRITIPEFYNSDVDWKAEDSVAIVTIPVEPWITGGRNAGYFKFVSALYRMPSYLK